MGICLVLWLEKRSLFFIFKLVYGGGGRCLLLQSDPNGRSDDQSATDKAFKGWCGAPDDALYDERADKLRVLLCISYCAFNSGQRRTIMLVARPALSLCSPSVSSTCKRNPEMPMDARSNL